MLTPADHCIEQLVAAVRLFRSAPRPKLTALYDGEPWAFLDVPTQDARWVSAAALVSTGLVDGLVLTFDALAYEWTVPDPVMMLFVGGEEDAPMLASGRARGEVPEHAPDFVYRMLAAGHTQPDMPVDWRVLRYDNPNDDEFLALKVETHFFGPIDRALAMIWDHRGATPIDLERPEASRHAVLAALTEKLGTIAMQIEHGVEPTAIMHGKAAPRSDPRTN